MSQFTTFGQKDSPLARRNPHLTTVYRKQKRIQSKSNPKSESNQKTRNSYQKSKSSSKTENNHPNECQNQKNKQNQEFNPNSKNQTRKLSVQSKNKRQISQNMALRFIIIQSMPRGYLRPHTCVNDSVARQWFATYFILS